MTTPLHRPRHRWVLMFVAVCLVALNLRVTITGVGPLLDEIASDQGVSPAALGLLAAVPLMVWAVVSPLAQSIADRIGLDAAVGWALVLLMAATVWRSLPGAPANLWLGTVLLGIALAITNVLLPATIKRDFTNKIPLMMGLYSALIGVSGAAGAAMVAPIAHQVQNDGSMLGWRWALLATGITLPLALLAWVLATFKGRRGDQTARTDTSTDPTSIPTQGAARRVWRDSVAWQIALHMGSQSATFYIYATWLAPIDVSRGVDPITAGFSVTIFHIFGMLGSLLGPLLSRGAMRRLLPIMLPVISFIGFWGFVFGPDIKVAWLVACGLSSGAALTVSMTLIGQRSATTEIAGATSGMVQSIGYLIAGVGPLVFGWFFEISGGWLLPLFAAAVAGTLQFVAAVALSRERMVFSRA
ncbi:MAG: MFS transporter [Leucobacter sp.]|nr:MFS transporter [Leucobacter sp.]